MSKLLIFLGLTCVVFADANFPHYIFSSKANKMSDQPSVEPHCDPPCQEGKCCSAVIPAASYTCTRKTSANKQTCIKNIKQCSKCNKFKLGCCIQKMKKGFCASISKTHCLNPKLFVVSAKCCPKGKVCKSKNRTNFFGKCKKP